VNKLSFGIGNAVGRPVGLALLRGQAVQPLAAALAGANFMNPFRTLFTDKV
jgi:hypothetical protein